MNISEEVLMGAAAVSVTLIGFSGVVTALGQGRNRPWTRAEAVQLFALVAPSIVTLFCAFVPIGAGLLIDNSDIVWRTANGACFLGHLFGVTYFIHIGSRMPVRFSHKIGLTCTFSVMAVLLLSALGVGSWYEFTFLLGLLLGIGVSVHNFYLLLSPAISGDADQRDSA